MKATHKISKTVYKHGADPVNPEKVSGPVFIAQGTREEMDARFAKILQRAKAYAVKGVSGEAVIYQTKTNIQFTMPDERILHFYLVKFNN